jgi:hypothetical protein
MVLEEEVHEGVEVGIELMARMMCTFPRTVIRYMQRNGCLKSGSSVRLMNWNSEAFV